MKRQTTNRINYLLDNWVPPRLRDSRILMGIAMRLALGPKYKYYMTFKERAGGMSEEKINAYYDLLADTFISRKTDLNEGCINYILDHITGQSVLDAAAGKGYLARRIFMRGGVISVNAADIVLPEDKMEGILYDKASLTSLPYEDHAFDTVICTHALEHIKDYQAAVSELRRVCRKRLIIVVPKQREYQYTFDLHLNFFPYQYHVRRLLQNKDVKILEIGHDWLCVEDQDCYAHER